MLNTKERKDRTMKQTTVDFLRRLGKTEEEIENIEMHTDAYNELDNTIWMYQLSEETKRVIITDTFHEMQDKGHNNTECVFKLAKMFNAHCADVYDYLWNYCGWDDLAIADEDEFIDSFY